MSLYTVSSNHPDLTRESIWRFWQGTTQVDGVTHFSEAWRAPHGPMLTSDSTKAHCKRAWKCWLAMAMDIAGLVQLLVWLLAMPDVDEPNKQYTITNKIVWPRYASLGEHLTCFRSMVSSVWAHATKPRTMQLQSIQKHRNNSVETKGKHVGN